MEEWRMQLRGSIPIGIGEMLSTHITDNKFLFQYYFIFLYDHVSTYVLSEWHATKELQTSEDNKLKEPETWNLKPSTVHRLSVNSKCSYWITSWKPDVRFQLKNKTYALYNPSRSYCGPEDRK